MSHVHCFFGGPNEVVGIGGWSAVIGIIGGV